MSKVVRLSDKEIEMLEEFKRFKLSQYNKMIGEYPYMSRDIAALENASIEELLFDALSSACFWEQKNDEEMK